MQGMKLCSRAKWSLRARPPRREFREAYELGVEKSEWTDEGVSTLIRASLRSDAGRELDMSQKSSPKDPEDLVDLRVTWEERLAHNELGEDAADGPHIDSSRVVTRAKEDFRCTVPECDNLSSASATGKIRC